MRKQASPTSPWVGLGPGGLQGVPKGRRVTVERWEATQLSPNERTQDVPGAEGNYCLASEVVRRRERR